MLVELAAEKFMLCFSINISVACGVSLNFSMDVILHSNHYHSGEIKTNYLKKKQFMELSV